MLQNNHISGTFFGHIGERERERRHNLLNPASLLSRIVTTAPPLQPYGALRTDAREMVSTHTSTTPVSPRSPKRKHHLKHLSLCSNGASSNATYTDGSVGLPLGHRPSRPGSAASAASSSTPCLVLPPQQESIWAPNPLFCLANLTDAAVPWLFCHFPIQFQWALNVDFWYTHFSLKFNPSSSKSNSDQP